MHAKAIRRIEAANGVQYTNYMYDERGAAWEDGRTGKSHCGTERVSWQTSALAHYRREEVTPQQVARAGSHGREILALSKGR